MQKIVIAMDSFKGTMSSLEAGGIIKSAFSEVFPSAWIEVVSVADGGEGMVDAMMQNLKGKIRRVTVLGPLEEKTQAAYGLAGDTAVIEMAAASGLPLLNKNEYNPEKTTTYGTGQLILDAVASGAKKIIVGLGGSATNDAGAGMAQALGISIRDAEGRELSAGGKELARARLIDFGNYDARLKQCEIIGACDVKNPLCGENGASYVYGPQKGADRKMVKRLDEALMHFSSLVGAGIGKDFSQAEGAGAAGGLGFGLMAFCGAKLRTGIDTVLQAARMQERLLDADLLVTGEGSMDSQTINGKTPVGVAKYAASANIPVIAISGQTRKGFESVYKAGIQAALSTTHEITTLEEALKHAKDDLYGTALIAARLIRIGQKQYRPAGPRPLE